MAPSSLIPPTPSQEAYAVDEDQGDVFTTDDPLALFADWLALAGQTEPNDPNAMALATIGPDGAPDVRVVLLKDIDERGLTFFTNRESAKGQGLAANPTAALCFHWKSVRRQVRFRGDVTEVTPAEVDAYFASRARGARIGAWASAQSRPMPHENALVESVAEHEARFDGAEVPRPASWSGYRLEPREIEFWVNRPFRLHDRLLFARDVSGNGWKTSRLFP